MSQSEALQKLQEAADNLRMAYAVKDGGPVPDQAVEIIEQRIDGGRDKLIEAAELALETIYDSWDGGPIESELDKETIGLLNSAKTSLSETSP